MTYELPTPPEHWCHRCACRFVRTYDDPPHNLCTLCVVQLIESEEKAA